MHTHTPCCGGQLEVMADINEKDTVTSSKIFIVICTRQRLAHCCCSVKLVESEIQCKCNNYCIIECELVFVIIMTDQVKCVKYICQLELGKHFTRFYGLNKLIVKT